MATIQTRERKDGTVAYRVVFRADGRHRSETFGSAEHAQQFSRMIDRLGGAAALAKRDLADRTGPAGPTLSNALDSYLERSHDLTTGTRDDYRRIFERSGINERLAATPVNLITEDDIHAWVSERSRAISEITDRQISAKTIRNEHGLLSAVLAHAVQRGWCQANTARGVRLPRLSPSDPLILTDAQYKAIHSKMDPDYRPFVEFLAVTGVRWGEATALQWGDINRTVSPPRVTIRRAWKRGMRGAWSVEGLPKTDASHRTFTIPQRLLERLGKPGRANVLVFTGKTGKAISHSNFHSRKWVRACEAAQVTDPRPKIHDLRHYMASVLLAAGVPIHVVSRRLGHENITTTVNIYAFLTPDMQVAGLDDMERMLIS